MGADPVRPAQWIERALVVFGLACLGYYGHQTTEARNFQREQTAAFEALLEERGRVAPSAPSAPSTPAVLALLEIPRLKLSSPVLSGDDAAVLDIAVGHLSDTPKPWEPGNTAFAAHRDGLFRSLRDVRLGDEVHVRTQHGAFTYTVRETKIVRPDDLSVLAPTSGQTLTLITCYPFDFVGSAPKRFIVHAELRRN